MHMPYDKPYDQAEASPPIARRSQGPRGLQRGDGPRGLQRGRTKGSPGSASRGGLRWSIVLFLILALFACVAAAVLVPAGLGYWAGYSELQGQNHENAIQHFQRGLGYLADNYPELAFTEFEIAVKYDASYEPAQQKLKEMQATMAGHGTPQPQEEDRVAASLFREAQDLVAKKQWSEAINRLEQLRNLNTNYRKQEVQSLSYTAYVGGGKDAVATGQIEVARERFDSALAIRNDDADVQHQRDLAVLYLDGQQAAGYNWALAIQKFSDLYKQDPNYDDVKRRLVDAYTQYGDLTGRQNAWCLAAREYDYALALVNDPQVSSKRAQAMTNCRQAIVATPTLAATPGTTPGVGNYNYRMARVNKPCTTRTGDVSGIVSDVLGQPLSGVAVAYYADGINRVVQRTDANGAYQFIWGNDPGLFHIIILGADGTTPVSLAADVRYPGGSSPDCHWTVDWQRVQ